MFLKDLKKALSEVIITVQHRVFEVNIFYECLMAEVIMITINYKCSVNMAVPCC